jgi:hypothetical protein
MIRFSAHACLILGVCLHFGAGCASVKLTPLVDRIGDQTQAPAKIMVKKFSLSDPDMGNRDSTQSEVRDIMHMKLAEELSRHGHEVIPIDESDRLPSKHENVPCWIVSGQFQEVNKGHQGLRIVVGLGAGKSSLSTLVKVCETPSNVSDPLMEFATKGSSGAQPGVLLVPITGPSALLGAGLQGTLALRAGIRDDARRTAKKVAAHLTSRLASLPRKSP